MKRNVFSTAALLAAFLVTGTLFSCGDEGTQTESTGTVTEGTAAATTEAAEETEALYTATLKTQDFGGAAIRIASSNDLVGYEIPTTIQFATEETGEIVNDTLYARDLWIEENYNVDIQFDDKRDWVSNNYLQGVRAGDLPFEFIMQDTGSHCNNLSIAGALYPLNMVKGINLDADYWFPELNRELYVGEDLYFAACPISPRYYGSVYVIMFNRDLATSLDLPDFYESVKNGTWTIDLMAECAKQALRDVDGNGKWDENDIYGMVYEVLTPEAMVLGAGYHYIENQNGEMKIMLEDEGLVDFIERIKIMYAADYTVYDNNQQLTTDIQKSGNYLFWNPCTFNLASFRDFTYDFGILPMPKADEQQDKYYAYSQPWATATAMVPVTTAPEDLPMVGTIIDAMTAYGYDYVRPAVLENVLQLKSARDEKSAEIIDMMFENITFEILTIFWNNLYGTMQAHFTSKLGKEGIASTYASVKDKSIADIEKTMQTYREFHDEFEAALG